MKLYTITYQPLKAGLVTKLIPVWGYNLRHAVRVADDIMQTRRALQIKDFSTKVEVST